MIALLDQVPELRVQLDSLPILADAKGCATVPGDNPIHSDIVILDGMNGQIVKDDTAIGALGIVGDLWIRCLACGAGYHFIVFLVRIVTSGG